MTANRIGIDFSQDYFDLCLANSDGKPITSKRFSHDQLGSQAALDYILPLCQAHPADQVWIGGEATGLLWWHLYQQWAQDDQLAQLNPIFHLLNPAHIKGFRRSTSRQDKTDPKDARLITRYLGVPDQDLHIWQPDASYWGLRFLTRTRFRLAHLLASYKLQAYNMLYIKASAYRQVMPFSDVFGRISLEFLRSYLCLEEVIRMPVQDLATELDQFPGHAHLPDPSQNAAKLGQVARLSYSVDPLVLDSANFILNRWIELIEALEKELRTFDRFITQRCESDLDIQNLDRIGGISLIFAAGLAAELRPIERFFVDDKLDPQTGIRRPRTASQAQAAAAKLAGLWWPANQSGKFNAEERHMPIACNAYLRYYLVEAANHVREYVAEYGQYY
ncbi:IS110 family transposase, partial [bacterium]